MSQPRPVQAGHRVVQRPVSRSRASASRPAAPGRRILLGDPHVVGVHHPGHALAHGPQVVQLGLDEGRAGSKAAVPGRETARDAQLRVRLQHVVLLDEGLLGRASS